ncbi:MAG: phage tail protein [Syntrophomonas sp.]
MMNGGYFSMKSRRTFQRGHSSNLHVTDEGLSLSSIYSYQLEMTIKPDENGRPPFIKDFAVDKRILIYMLDELADIWVYDFQENHSECLITGGKGLFSNHALISVSDDVLLVAEPAGEEPILAFSCKEGYLLWSKGEIDGQPIFPLAVAVDRAGFFYVLSGGRAKASSIFKPQTIEPDILKFDKNGQLMGKIPVADLEINYPDFNNPEILKGRFSLCCGADNRIFLLDSRERRVYCQDEEGHIIFLFQENMVEKPSGLGVDINNKVYLGDFRKLDLQAEDDRFLMIFDTDGHLLEKVPGYRGSIDKMVLEEGGRVIVYNGETDNLHLFNLKNNMMFDPQTGGLQGIYLSHSFDSKVIGNQWHRIELLADIPEETQVALSYFASDSNTFNFRNTVWEIDDFIKSEDFSIADKMSMLEGLWNETVFNPGDVLIHKAKGRYLWFCLRLKGTNEYSPSISRIRVHYCRNSLLQYLPMVYQEDAVSSDFLGRFLAIFETFFSGFEEEIASIPRYFDIKAMDGDFLRWLSTWIGVPEDQDWDEEILRRYLESSPEIYRKRGTRQGLENIIEIFTGKKPFIVEYPQISYMKDHPEMSLLMEKLYTKDPNSFVVLMKRDCFETRRMALQIERLLEEEKPAFTEAHLVILGDNLYLDSHSYLGINSALAEFSLLYLNEGAAIPFETVLTEVKDGK